MNAVSLILSIGKIEGYLLSLPNVPDPIWDAVKALTDYHCEEQPILKSGDRVLMKNQINADDDGVYEVSDEEKIAEHLANHGVTKVKKERKPSNMSPENREAAAQRMRDLQARKKAEKLAAEGKPVTMVMRRTEEPILDPDEDESSVGNGDAPEDGADTEEGIILENGVKQLPDGSFKL